MKPDCHARFGSGLGHQRANSSELKHMKSTIVPRLLCKSAAADYCGISLGIFDRLQPAAPIRLQQGHERLDRYDVVDLDRWIDRLKGPPAKSAEHWLDRLGTGSTRQ
jgi:hypothetical protein